MRGKVRGKVTRVDKRSCGATPNHRMGSCLLERTLRTSNAVRAPFERASSVVRLHHVIPEEDPTAAGVSVALAGAQGALSWDQRLIVGPTSTYETWGNSSRC